MLHSPDELKNLVASPCPSFGCYASKKTRNTQKVAKNQKMQMTGGLKHDLKEKRLLNRGDLVQQVKIRQGTCSVFKY